MTSDPKLQPPGAGLPLAQLVFLKIWLGPFVSKRTPPKKSRETYEKLTKKIIEYAASLSDEQRSEKVLVDPIRGLEDSSRYWSMNGVLEHLMMVSTGVEATILALSSGTVPNQKVDTAKVKPAQKGQDYLAQFTERAPGLMSRLDEKLSQPNMNFESQLKLKHPWFGKMTAKQWYWLLGTHQGIHYQQAQQIASALKRQS